MEKISVVIVNWNVAKSLQKCLQSLLATRCPNLEIIVIDNASGDNSGEMLKKFSQIKLIVNKQNLGFPKAVNQGLRMVTGDYILVLNPDARLPRNFFVESINFAKNHPNMGVMGPKLVDPDGTVQGSVFDEPSIFGPNQKYAPTGVKAVFAVSGACMFLPKSTLTKIGYLTEEVFMYYEDLDYCRRIHQAGLQVYFSPEITVVHEHGSSAKQNPEVADWRGQLWKSSLWYNGPMKHYIMWFISWTHQKLHSLFV